MILGVWRWLKRTPWSAHLLRANDRYNNRLGNQLAGGITYFSILTLIPVLMLLFSALGLATTVIHTHWTQQWLKWLQTKATNEVNSAAGGENAVAQVNRALKNWKSVGLIAVLSASYSGSGWMGNLRGAVRAQWRPDFDWSPPGRNFIAERFVNLMYFGLLVMMVTVTFATTALGGQLADRFIGWLGLANNQAAGWAVTAGLFLLAIALGYGMFYFLFEVLPQYEAPSAAMAKGSLMAAVLLAALQYGTTYLIGLFSRSLASIVFGNLIIVMLFFNLFARLTLFAAAWIATSYQPAFPRRYNETDAPLRGQPGVVTVPGHWTAADLDHARILARKGATLPPRDDEVQPSLFDQTPDYTWLDADDYHKHFGNSGRPLIRRRSRVPYVPPEPSDEETPQD